MQTKTINGTLYRRVMPGEIIQQGDMWWTGEPCNFMVRESVPVRCAIYRPIQSPAGTEAKVCADIAARQAKGIAKYGTTVADNPLSRRQWLQHAYEDALELAVDLRRLIDMEEGT